MNDGGVVVPCQGVGMLSWAVARQGVRRGGTWADLGLKVPLATVGLWTGLRVGRGQTGSGGCRLEAAPGGTSVEVRVDKCGVIGAASGLCWAQECVCARVCVCAWFTTTVDQWFDRLGC